MGDTGRGVCVYIYDNKEGIPKKKIKRKGAGQWTLESEKSISITKGVE